MKLLSADQGDNRATEPCKWSDSISLENPYVLFENTWFPVTCLHNHYCNSIILFLFYNMEISENASQCVSKQKIRLTCRSMDCY